MGKKKTGLVQFDSAKFEKASLRVGLSLLELFKKAGIDQKAGYKIASGGACRVSNALRLAKALGVDDLNELLATSDEKQGESVFARSDSTGLPAAWDVENSISAWITAANGLQYRVYRLKHRHLPEEIARGKCFDLDNMACEQAGELRDVLLVRHAQVCRALASSSFFPTNQSVDISGNQCWVIDSWPHGESLAKLGNHAPNILHRCKNFRFLLQKSLRKHLKISVMVTFIASKTETLRAKLLRYFFYHVGNRPVQPVPFGNPVPSAKTLQES